MLYILQFYNPNELMEFAKKFQLIETDDISK